MADVTTIDSLLSRSLTPYASLLFVSDKQTVSSGDDVILTEGTTAGFVISGYTHIFLGVEFLDASDAVVTPGAGTMTISVQTINTLALEAVWESPTTATITAATPTTIDWAANTHAIKVAQASVTTATQWRVRITANRS